MSQVLVSQHGTLIRLAQILAELGWRLNEIDLLGGGIESWLPLSSQDGASTRP